MEKKGGLYVNGIVFNLVDEPWIRVMMPDCSVREVSLAEALSEAHHFRGLAGEMEAQNVAMLRMLIALVHTVFTRVNLNGEDEPVETEKSAIDRWTELLVNGCFPKEPVKDYLEKWHERFWLFHPERPFYQALNAKTGTINSVAKLNGEVSESSNKTRLFSVLNSDGRQGMSFAESARWLLFLNGFDDCAAKQKDKSSGSRSMTVAWLGKLGLVTAVGSSLFETILLNMTMLADSTGKLWAEDDCPVWELQEPSNEERRTISMPNDYAGLLTLQSRRIMLIREGQNVVKYGILGGDAFDEKNSLNEPMTVWRFVEDKKTQTSFFIPRRHERARQIWRDFGSLVNTGEGIKRPGVVSWCSRMQEKGVFPHDRLLTFKAYCVRYDSSQSSSITDAFSDALSFHADLLIEAGQIWIREINHQLLLIEDAAFNVGKLAEDLGKAVGQGEDDLKNVSVSAKERFYHAVDLPFRDWLLKLDPDQEADERTQLIGTWQKQAWKTAAILGRQLVEEKGDIAFVGRSIEKNNKQRHYSSPEAYRWFRYHLNKIYELAKEGDELMHE